MAKQQMQKAKPNLELIGKQMQEAITTFRQAHEGEGEQIARELMQANATTMMEDALQSSDGAAIVMSRLGKPRGFGVDDQTYNAQELVPIVASALIKGASFNADPHEFMVLRGNSFFHEPFYVNRLHEAGISFDVKCHEIEMQGSSARVAGSIRYKLPGQPKDHFRQFKRNHKTDGGEFDTRYFVKVNSGQDEDAVRGKFRRKVLRDLLQSLTNMQYADEDDVFDVESAPVEDSVAGDTKGESQVESPASSVSSSQEPDGEPRGDIFEADKQALLFDNWSEEISKAGSLERLEEVRVRLTEATDLTEETRKRLRAIFGERKGQLTKGK